MNSFSFQWLSIFTIIHTLTQFFIYLLPDTYKSESMRIYYHDSSAIMMYLIELCLGLGILFSYKNMFAQMSLLIALQTLIYFPLSMLDTTDGVDYLHLYKRYFEDNKHFMGFVPLALSFAILPIIMKKQNVFNDQMYSISFYMIVFKLFASYEDL